MAAPAPSSSSASAGRRGITPPPRQERPAVSASSVRENAIPSLASQQAARINNLLKRQQTPGPSATGLPRTPSSSPSSQTGGRPSRRITTQPNALGNLLARQQFDEGPATDNSGEYDDREPDYFSEEPDLPEQQSSVLDMANQRYTPGQDIAANDNNRSIDASDTNREQSPNEQIAQRNRAFIASQAQNQAQQAHFTQQRSNRFTTTQDSTAETDTPPSNPTNRFASFLKKNALERVLDASKDPQSPLSTQNIEETVSEVQGLTGSARRLGTFAGGILSLTFLLSLQPLAEQNIVVINRLVFNGSIGLPGMGGRAPDALKRNPSLKWIDRIDLFLALCMNVITGAIIMIVIGICAAIAYIFYLLTTNSLDLYQQLIN